jgi:hypothetical protein
MLGVVWSGEQLSSHQCETVTCAVNDTLIFENVWGDGFKLNMNT